MPAARRLTAAVTIAAATAGLTACGSETTTDTTTATTSTTAVEVPADTETAPSGADTAPIAFETITERDLKLIAKNPADHKDRAIVVYGRVEQSMKDEAEDDIIRVVGGATPDPTTWDVDLMLGTRGDELRNIVEDDEFRAEVTTTGETLTYTSIVGIEFTNPAFIVRGISLLES